MKILDKKEYDFLRTNKDLSQIIYLVMSGSHAYGMELLYQIATLICVGF